MPSWVVGVSTSDLFITYCHSPTLFIHPPPHTHLSLQIKGLPEALQMPDSMVSSNYSAKYAPKTFENMKRFTGGNAIFNMPTMPIKCPGAPQKIMYLADDYWRKVRRLRRPSRHMHVLRQIRLTE